MHELDPGDKPEAAEEGFSVFSVPSHLSGADEMRGVQEPLPSGLPEQVLQGDWVLPHGVQGAQVCLHQERTRKRPQRSQVHLP